MSGLHVVTVFTDVGVVNIFFGFGNMASADAPVTVGACACTEGVGLIHENTEEIFVAKKERGGN
jgi:hypothetical protein